MAQAKAICRCERCGQTFTKITTKYSRREADEWTAWAEKNCTVCSECYKAEQAAKAAGSFAFPELTGSEKQVRWANDIRTKMIRNLTECVEMTDECDEIVESFLSRTTQAAWWINHRSDDLRAFTQAMMQ